MQLTIFNGSPRGKESNTKILMDHFARGFTQGKENRVEIIYLNKTQDTDNHLEKFKNSRHAILAFPLYTDAMPGIVKYFIETLKPVCGGKDNPSLGFVIQSGFPEPIHSRFVARYMEKLVKRLGCSYSGTVIRGGAEGIQVMPLWMTKKLFKNFNELGKHFAVSQSFNQEVVQKLAPWEKMSFLRRLFYKILFFIGLSNMYWNMKLKKNNSYDKRFAHPFKDF